MRKTLKLSCGLLVLAAMPHLAKAADDQQFRITSLSSRPEMVSGGDVLVQVDVPQSVPLNNIMIKVNGQDATAALHPGPTAHALTGLVTGLKLGENTLEVFNSQRQGARESQLTLKNYPITGPIISGSQEQPFI